MEQNKAEGFKRNIGTLTAEQQAVLHMQRAAVVGCGGLGGLLADFLARVGVGHLVLIDGDSFEVTNANRQILYNKHTVGKNKALVGKKHIEDLGLGTSVLAHPVFLTRENGENLLKGCDLVLDALDSVQSRLMLEALCESSGLTIIHGGVGEWAGQAAVVRPGSKFHRRFYGNSALGQASTIAPAVGMAASLEAALAVRFLLGLPCPENTLIAFDLNRFDILCTAME